MIITMKYGPKHCMYSLFRNKNVFDKKKTAKTHKLLVRITSNNNNVCLKCVSIA